MSALQRAGAPAGTRIRLVCAVLGSRQTKGCLGMDLVYHCARHRCRVGLGAPRVVPAALGGGGISQSFENGMRDGAATIAECARAAGSLGLSGPCGGASAAVTRGGPHRPGHASKTSSRAGVGGRNSAFAGRASRPNDGEPVLARGSRLGRILGTQRRRRSRLANLVAWLATLTGSLLGLAGGPGSGQEIWVRTRPKGGGFRPGSGN